MNPFCAPSTFGCISSARPLQLFDDLINCLFLQEALQHDDALSEVLQASVIDAAQPYSPQAACCCQTNDARMKKPYLQFPCKSLSHSVSFLPDYIDEHGSSDAWLELQEGKEPEFGQDGCQTVKLHCWVLLGSLHWV